VTPGPVFVPVRQLAEWVATRRVSPVALAETFLDRLESLGPKYNAVVTVTRDRALDEARRTEREIAAGRYRGPLHGIPYGAKDLLATGQPLRLPPREVCEDAARRYWNWYKGDPFGQLDWDALVRRLDAEDPSYRV